jgi:hypothetical protein
MVTKVIMVKFVGDAIQKSSFFVDDAINSVHMPLRQGK